MTKKTKGPEAKAPDAAKAERREISIFTNGPFSHGDAVTHKATGIKGTIGGITQWGTDSVRYGVEYADKQGVFRSEWFYHNELVKSK